MSALEELTLQVQQQRQQAADGQLKQQQTAETLHSTLKGESPCDGCCFQQLQVTKVTNADTKHIAIYSHLAYA